MEPAALAPNALDRNVTPLAAADLWGADVTTVTHVSDGASFTYRVRVRGKTCYLRLTPPGWQSMAEVRGELSVVVAAHSAGVPTPLPISSRRGELVERVPNRSGEMLAVLFEEARGQAITPKFCDEEHAVAWGSLLAEMHNCALRRLPSGQHRRDWRDELARVANWLPSEETLLHNYLVRSTRWLESLPQTPEVYGLVHFDLQADNVLWVGTSPTVIDFDDCLFHWFAADIAQTIATFDQETNARRRQLTLWLLDGYGQVRYPDVVTAEWLPRFAMLTSIGSLAWHLHSVAYGLCPPESRKIERNLRGRIAATWSSQI